MVIPECILQIKFIILYHDNQRKTVTHPVIKSCDVDVVVCFSIIFVALINEKQLCGYFL